MTQDQFNERLMDLEVLAAGEGIEDFNNLYVKTLEEVYNAMLFDADVEGLRSGVYSERFRELKKVMTKKLDSLGMEWPEKGKG